MRLEIIERRKMTVLVDDPRGEFEKIHPVCVYWQVVKKTPSDPGGTVVGQYYTLKDAKKAFFEMSGEAE